MATPRTDETETEDTATFPEPSPIDVEAHLAYLDGRVRALQHNVYEQERAQRRLMLTLIVLGYVFVFGYLMGRDNGTSHS